MSGPESRPQGRLRRSDCSGRDPGVKAAIEAMRRRRSGPDDLLVYRENGAWSDVRSEDVNAYLQGKAGEDISAKDFRTWHGTVLAAVELAREGGPRRSVAALTSTRARDRPGCDFRPSIGVALS